MRSLEEELDAAREGAPFSNQTEWDIWADDWCHECVTDSVELVDQGKGCPLISVALLGKTPAQWTLREGTFCDYSCAEFRRRRPDDDGGGDGGPDPTPPPTPEVEGQVDIFEVFADQITEQAGRELVTR